MAKKGVQAAVQGLEQAVAIIKKMDPSKKKTAKPKTKNDEKKTTQAVIQQMNTAAAPKNVVQTLGGTAIQQYKQDYAKANKAGNYQGMRAANQGANAVRKTIGVDPYSSAVGDKQRANHVQIQKIQKSYAKDYEIGNYRGMRGSNKKANALRKEIGEPTVSSKVADQKRAAYVQKLQEMEHQNTTQPYYPSLARLGVHSTASQQKAREKEAIKDLKNPVVRGNVGAFDALMPFHVDLLGVDKQVENTAAYKVGKFIGTGAQSRIPNKAAGGAIVKGAEKMAPGAMRGLERAGTKVASKIPKVSQEAAEKFGKGVAASVAKNLVLSPILNTNYALNKEGLRGNDALKSIAMYTGLDLGVGAALEAVPTVYRAIRGEGDLIPVLKNGKQGYSRQTSGNLNLDKMTKQVGDRAPISKANQQQQEALRQWVQRVHREASINKINSPVEAIQASKATSRMKIEDFRDPNSSAYNNIAYDDKATQRLITTHVANKMLNEGSVVKISDADLRQLDEFFPDLRAMKKEDRIPIQRENKKKLKGILKASLENKFKGKQMEFTINGNLIEARMYNIGVREVLDKLIPSKAAMINKTDEIFSKARYLYSTGDKSGNPDIYRWNYFYVPLKIGEHSQNVSGVRLAIRDVKKADESQIYNFGIKKEATSPNGPGGQSPSLSDGAQVTSNNNLSHPDPIVNPTERPRTEGIGEDGIGARYASAVQMTKEAKWLGLMTEKQAKIVQRLTMNHNVPIRFDDLPKGVDGTYKDGVITISRNAENPFMETFKHELTHHLESSGMYRALSDHIVNYAEKSGLDVGKAMKQIAFDYADAGKLLRPEEIKKEFVAKFSGEYLFQDATSIKRLARENPNLFKKVYDWIADTIRKVGKSEDTKFLIDAQRKYEAALRSSYVKESGNVQFSFKGYNKLGIPEYKSDFPKNMSQNEREVI